MAGTYIDLSHPLENGISTFPGSAPHDFSVLHTIPEAGYHERRIQMSSHMGTHIDAPCHIVPNTRKLDKFPMEKFIGKATVIDISHTQVTKTAHLIPFAEKIEQVDFVLFYTGWQSYWKRPRYAENYPVLQPAATQWLSGFHLKAVGFDTLSPDPVSSTTLPNHHILLEKEILIIENLNNLDQLIDQVFDFYCIPLPVALADGAPVRAFAQKD